jgi:feruloyl esterase
MKTSSQGCSYYVARAVVLAFTTVLAETASATTATCSIDALNALQIKYLDVTSATLVASANGVPEYCQISGNVTTHGEGVGKGSAGVQISLPSNWNGKFLFMGGGGFDGVIFGIPNPADLIKGYAMAGTDSGHMTNPAETEPSNDASWSVISLGVPDKIKLADYFYRSRHDVVVATKELIKSYYGDPIHHAYFSGCSNGGHEAVKQAMRYPDDFEGVIAGDPWIDQPGNELWNLRNIKELLNAWIPPSAFPAIQKAVYAQCDAADGVVDGLIQNPAKCAFNPDTLVPSVLSQQQSNALKVYLSAVRDETGTLVFPGSSVAGIGAATESNFPSVTGLAVNEVPIFASLATAVPAPYPTGPQPWGSTFTSPSNWQLAFGVIGDFGYRDLNANLVGDLVIDSNGRARTDAVDLVYRRAEPGLATDPEDLRRFIGMGHKLLIYDGYADSTLNPYKTILFYEDLAQESGGYQKTQENVRLFMFPDMEHCGLGGVGLQPVDTLTPLENWVEQGLAPEFLMASHTTGPESTGLNNRTMPVCKFPEQARYNGSGNLNDASSWSCPPNQGLLEVGPNGIAAGLGKGEDGDE